MTQIFRLTHENPNNLVAVLRPLISPNNTINANPGNNSLVITDYADNLQRIGQDHRRARPARAPTSKCSRSSTRRPATWRRSCSAWPIRRPGAPGAPEHPARGFGRRSWSIQRTNSLIVRAANPARDVAGARLSTKLDQPAQRRRRARQYLGGVPEERRCDQLATVLRAALTGQRRRHRHRPRSPAREPRTDRSRTRLRGPTAGAPGPASAGHVPCGGRSPSTGGFIQADPASQLADHHRTRPAVPPASRGDRPARLAARPGLRGDA